MRGSRRNCWATQLSTVSPSNRLSPPSHLRRRRHNHHHNHHHRRRRRPHSHHQPPPWMTSMCHRFLRSSASLGSRTRHLLRHAAAAVKLAQHLLQPRCRARGPVSAGDYMQLPPFSSLDSLVWWLTPSIGPLASVLAILSCERTRWRSPIPNMRSSASVSQYDLHSQTVLSHDETWLISFSSCIVRLEFSIVHSAGCWLVATCRPQTRDLIAPS